MIPVSMRLYNLVWYRNSDKKMTVTINTNPDGAIIHSGEISELITNGLEAVGPDDIINVTMLDQDKLYGFAVGSEYDRNWYWYTDGICNIMGSVFLFETDASSVSFSLSSLGFNDETSISFFEVPKKTYDQPLNDISTDKPVISFDKGVNAYIGWYDIDMSSPSSYGLDNASSVVMENVIDDNLQDRDWSCQALINRSQYGVQDFTGERFKLVGIFVKFDDATFNEGEAPFARGRMVFANTETLEDTTTATGPTAFIIPASDELRVIEATIPSNYWLNSTLNAADNGNSLCFGTAINYSWDNTENTTVLLVPRLEKDTYISFSPMSSNGSVDNEAEIEISLRTPTDEDRQFYQEEKLTDSDRTVTVELQTDEFGLVSPKSVYVDTSAISGKLSSFTVSCDSALGGWVEVCYLGDEWTSSAGVNLEEGTYEAFFDTESGNPRPYIINFGLSIAEGAVLNEKTLTITFE